MIDKKLTYEELETRLAEAEALVKALHNHQVDAIIGEKQIALVRLKEMEEELKMRQSQLEKKNGELEAIRRELEHRTGELEQANNELEAFTYSVSHDLKAPLRHITGFSELLAEDYAPVLNVAGREYLERIKSSAVKMSQLIDGLLKLSKIGRSELTRALVDLSRLVSIIVQEYLHGNPERNIRIIIHENIFAEADHVLMTQALENLLSNAFKYTAKTPHPRIEFGSFQRDRETVYFVRDNGVGFDMQYADRIFLPFNRLHSDTEFKGTGIGLSIVERIIRRHGGSIWVDAAVNEGATFYFTL